MLMSFNKSLYGREALNVRLIEAVSVWNAMESYQGQLVSESDTSEKRRNRASKLTGYSQTV